MRKKICLAAAVLLALAATLIGAASLASDEDGLVHPLYMRAEEGSRVAFSDLEGAGIILSGTGLMVGADGHRADEVLALVRSISTNATLEICSSDGYARRGDDMVGTGDLVRLTSTNGVCIEQAHIVVLGDVLGSGRTSLSQLVRMAQYMRGDEQPGPLALRAADFNEDGKIGITDLVREMRFLEAA